MKKIERPKLITNSKESPKKKLIIVIEKIARLNTIKALYQAHFSFFDKPEARHKYTKPVRRIGMLEIAVAEIVLAKIPVNKNIKKNKNPKTIPNQPKNLKIHDKVSIDFISFYSNYSKAIEKIINKKFFLPFNDNLVIKIFFYENLVLR